MFCLIIIKCSLIVWCESTISHKVYIEALDRTLRDLRNNSLPFGDLTVLFAGDFLQTLPIIRRGTRSDQVNACFKRSHLWSLVEKISLTTNMRALQVGNKHVSLFPKLLIQIGDGTLDSSDSISVSNKNICNNVKTINELIKQVYHNVQNICSMAGAWFEERVNMKVNNVIFQKFQAQEICYK